MGFIDNTGTFGTESDDRDYFPVFYNVVQGVGENCPNVRDDVMMVQYLLFWTYNPLPQVYWPKGEMKIDGMCGGITKNWILKFQLDVMGGGNSISTDKRVDRIRDKNGLKGSMSDTYYTLAYLNWYVADQSPEAYTKLPQVVPLQNILGVPPPSNDVVVPSPPQMVPAVGGL
jgi:hypothetical protein